MSSADQFESSLLGGARCKWKYLPSGRAPKSCRRGRSTELPHNRKQGSDQIVPAEGLLHERCDFVDGNRRDCVTGDDDDRDASAIEVIDETESHLLLQVQV